MRWWRWDLRRSRFPRRRRRRPTVKTCTIWISSCRETAEISGQMSFAILNEGRAVARPSKHYTLGIMDTDEDHATLCHNLGDLFTEINNLEGRNLYDERANKTYRL
jgi:hypothetical protein